MSEVNARLAELEGPLGDLLNLAEVTAAVVHSYVDLVGNIPGLLGERLAANATFCSSGIVLKIKALREKYYHVLGAEKCPA